MKSRGTPLLAWHFTGETLRDGRPIPAIGEPLRHRGRIVPCKAGLHASVEPFQALLYAPGSLLHRVECSGQIIPHDSDKIVCRQRTIIASIDATTLLRRFACDQAIEAFRIAAVTPPPIVAQWLETMDESIRDAARSAADAAWIAALSAARSAADAAWIAALSAAWIAADAAWSAALSAALSAARSAVLGAARKDFNDRVISAFGLGPKA